MSLSKPMRSIILFSTIFFFLSGVTAQEEIVVAVKKVEELKSKSTKFHSTSTNKFLITDINKDGVYEIIERVNGIENQSLGLLNTEIYPAFQIDKIYQYTNGTYVENYSNYKEYLTIRKEHYKLWKQLLENPELLNEDSKSLIKFNKDLFLNEINSIIEAIDLKIE